VPPPSPPANQLTGLSYSTYAQSGGSGGQAPYIILNIDNNDDGVFNFEDGDDLLFFEPVYQNGTYPTVDPSITIPNQCGDNPACVTPGQWQTWDAYNGGWWSLNAGTFGPPLTTLTFYRTQHPTATIINSSSGGGVRIVTGGGAGSWDNFVGNADAFTISLGDDVDVGPTTTIYDFEPSAPPAEATTGVIISELRTSGPGPGDITNKKRPVGRRGASPLRQSVAPTAQRSVAPTTATGRGGTSVRIVPVEPPAPLEPPPCCDGDEYVELYNNTDTMLNISETALYAITGGLPSMKFSVPANTTLLPRSHYLITGSTYSLGGAATSNGSLSSPIADDSGLGLFDNPVTATSADRLDSVGFANTTDPNYFEGTKLTPAAGVTADGEYAFVRRQETTTNRFPQDTGNNANDFVFVSTNGGTFSGLVSILGAPGPENSSSPRKVDPTFPDSLIDPGQSSSAAPNRTRDLTPVTNGANGTLTIRRAFTNNTMTTVTRLRFRIVDFTTFNSPNVHGGAQQADLRALNSGSTVVTVNGNPVTVEGTTVETPPAQPNGGGLNTSMGRSLVAGTIINTSIAPGQTINVQFVFGVQTSGKFRAFVSVEALP
jgi:hypothetical protein